MKLSPCAGAWAEITGVSVYVGVAVRTGVSVPVSVIVHVSVAE